MSDEWKYRDLPRANGQVAPSYWNPDTKEYEVYEGNVDVVEELASIKQTQNEILKRLDKPIDTKLTGSKVEDVCTIIGADVSSGGSIDPLGSYGDLSRYKEIIVYATRADDHDSSIRLRVTPYFSERTIYAISTDIYDKTLESNSFHSTDWIDVKSNTARVRIVNNDSESRRYDIRIFGRK